MGSLGYQPESALVAAAKEGTARLCAVFGGQGPNNLKGLEALIALNEAYPSDLSLLFNAAARTLAELASIPHISGFHEDVGFDILAWMADPESAPNRDYLALAPVSVPINTLLSLAEYCVTCHLLGLAPGQLRSLLQGVTGHSQGLFVAVAVAKSDSWPSFYEACIETLQLAFFIGLEAHFVAPSSTISEAAASDCIENGEYAPSSMLSVTGLDRAQIEKLVERLNKGLDKRNSSSSQLIHLALVNSRHRFVLSGPPQSLRAACLEIRNIRAADSADQTRVLAHKRKPVVDAQFMPVSAPFHSTYLHGLDARVAEDMELLQARGSRRWATTGHDLGVPVYHTQEGRNLQEWKAYDLLGVLVRAVALEIVDWPLVVRNLQSLGATHVLDFGPGSIGSLVHELAEGTGLRVIQMSDKTKSSSIGARDELLAREMPPAPVNWEQAFAPRLVTDDRGITQIHTKMTSVFGTPPIMVPGMTPTTVPWDFVATVTQAGYHVELAGGGYSDEKRFEEAIRKLAAAMPPCRGITCNLLYANPKTIAWQVSMLRRLVADGIPVEGITIGAGVPSPDVVREYIESIGLRHISFKPGSYSAIDQVIAIAQQYPDFPIGLQWSGGRAGGHHSWEDFHQPILKMYGRIRACANIVLIAGGGFGDGAGTFPYLTGEWAHAFGYPAMPFDGVMLGSRMMVAVEAHTSLQAKRLIVEAEGVADDQWHHTFDRPAGGVLTVESEMGQPIHVLATRGMKLWKEFDQRVFSIKDSAKRVEYLRAHRDQILPRLNEDFARPWFAVDEEGRNVELADMSYIAVLRRLCQLMYVHHQNRWIDPSYRKLVHDFVRLAAERYGESADLPQQQQQQERPDDIMHAFESILGADNARETLYPEDVSLLMGLFRRRGQKPVPFIPQLDENFATWFKKDSLWQSEDVDAVPGQDAERICIIQGPVAVRYATSCDETAQEILGRICQQHVQLLQQRHPNSAAALRTKRSTRYIRASSPQPPFRMPVIDGVRVTSDPQGLVTRFEVSKDFDATSAAATESLIEHVVGAPESWARACLVDKWIFRGPSRVPNPVRAAFQPQAGDVIEVKRQPAKSPVPTEIIFQSKGGSNATGISSQAGVMQLARTEHGGLVTVTLEPASVSPLKVSSSFIQPRVQFLFGLYRSMEAFRLYERMADRIEKVKALYTDLWITPAAVEQQKKNSNNNNSSNNVDMYASQQLAEGLSSEFSGEQIVLSERNVEEYASVVRRNGGSPPLQAWKPTGSVPLDYCIVLAWTALTKPLMIPALDCDLLQLLHRSISFRYAPGARPLRFGDAVQTFSRITALTSKPAGKLVEVSADILRQPDGERVVTVKTEFFIQNGGTGTGTGGSGAFDKQQFHSVEEPDMLLDVSTPIVQALLASRKWLIFQGPVPDLTGKTLVFRLATHSMFNREGKLAVLQVSGTVALATRDADGISASSSSSSSSSSSADLARVYFEEESCSGNPVMDFLQRHGRPRVTRQVLDNAGWSGASSIQVRAPAWNAPYAAASRDTNPIHTCGVFARYAGLPGGTVVHGMHTSAIVRRAVEWAVGDAGRTRFRAWRASFEGMVRPSDRLRVELQHVAMEEGRMVLRVQAFLQLQEEGSGGSGAGDKVLEAEAEVEQPATGYVFTGQGSQEKGMGMALYAAHPAARELWDRSDRYLREMYGFSLLHIVRDNPKSITIHFGGRRGRRLRDTYLAMKKRVPLLQEDDDGTVPVPVPGPGYKEVPVLEGLTPKSTSYTFSYPKGLLLSTQFSQPALAVMEMVEYAHLRARGVVQQGARFAGHSLGEYAALGACTTFMPFERLLSLVFYRGLKMQYALPRDEAGRTDYTMVAADPSRVGKQFEERHFQTLVETIADETGLLLEVVNFNVREQQYVCAGHIQAQWILGQLCDALSTQPRPHLVDAEALRAMVRAQVPAASKLPNTVTLQRGRATIPLAGIDIPFHSSMLHAEINDYRRFLAASIRVDDVKPHELVGRWVPNVVGRPFALDREYVELVQRTTGSEALAAMLREM